MLKPKFGMLNVLLDAYYEKQVENLQFVPITINYSRVLEGETFPFELLGEEKVKESLGRIVSAAKILRMNFGKIFVEFCDPISFQQYETEFLGRPHKRALQPQTILADRRLVAVGLGQELVHTLLRNLVIMPTSLVAGILLQYRKGISEDELIKQVQWLGNQVHERGGMLPFTKGQHEQQAVSVAAVRTGIFHLDKCIDKKKDIFEPSVSPRVDYKNILLLSYYKNSYVHLFIDESLVACSLFGSGQQIAWKDGVDKPKLWEQTKFLQNLLKGEFVKENYMDSQDDFEAVVALMKQRQSVFEKEDGRLVLNRNGESHIAMLCSLVWPLVDSYWIAFVFIFSLVPRKYVQESKIYQKIQWFAEALYEEKISSFFESCSQETIRNAVNAYLVGAS